ncbi:SGNH/GDSL hydrolase family protein [Streptococcus saliviloxodontae]|uniref:Lysophospholipase L1-like esterase n=1 Tax=Streptococcus saliviloxodontae TaxID=1349416 RepID=A0ABS2PMP0_9STRE|nr:SGNH/GDSL hydrolase family protein [Streptococcus saliviloxodontae]MBM7636697.1 lysophospholipase L1-like esterase [Streptococcus saliviloxodontae]
MNKALKWKGLTVFLVSLCLFSLVFWLLFPTVTSDTKKSTGSQSAKGETLHYLALGDSLTEGVGDSTQSGGFVPLLSHQLEEKYDYRVKSDNYGVSGNTSQQILKRLRKDKQLKQALQSADFMTLTVGGNDLMAVARKSLEDLTVDSFDEPAKSYQDRLRQLIELARFDNPDLPIYLVGIYNPFYKVLPDTERLETIVSNWNQASQEVTKEYKKVYFVTVDQVLYDGMDGQIGTGNEKSDSSQTENAVLYDGDHFHPNNTGYQLIANQIMEKINETKQEW